jgi:hypothetical protein
MTIQTRETIKSAFEQGDKPQGSDYTDWMDSIAFYANTSVNSFSGDLKAPSLIATSKVSAPVANVGSITVSGGSNANFLALISTQATTLLSAATSAVQAVPILLNGTRYWLRLYA